MKKIKLKVKQWLAKKLHKELLPYVMIDLSNEEMEFLLDSFHPNKNSNIFSKFVPNTYQMNLSTELIHNYRVCTGWTEDKVKEQIQVLNCNYWDALNVYKCLARFPTENEQIVLKTIGFQVFYELVRKQIIK